MNLSDSFGAAQADKLTTFQSPDHPPSPASDESHNGQLNSALPMNSASRLASRLAQLTVRLEEAIFERDLAQRVQARLEKEYRAPGQHRWQGADASHDLDVVRQEKQQLEQEKRRLEKELRQLRYSLAGLESERSLHRRLEQELQSSRQHAAALQAQVENLNESMKTILNSRGWRLAQSMRRLFGRAWHS